MGSSPDGKSPLNAVPLGNTGACGGCTSSALSEVTVVPPSVPPQLGCNPSLRDEISERQKRCSPTVWSGGSPSGTGSSPEMGSTDPRMASAGRMISGAWNKAEGWYLYENTIKPDSGY
uniref:Uncharacterized protein n=1 Tax=Hyaloperonospora arabidopsidis (strain Emoy2) TaxID=559515 RepID=M4B7G7_HYAAE